MNTKANVLLVTSAAPAMSPFSTEEKRMPLGMGFLISALKNAGHNVFFIDNYLSPDNFPETAYLTKNKIDFVGIYANTVCYRDTFRMLAALEEMRRSRRWNGKIIVGGPHTSVAPETIPDYVDFVVQGEGEKAIVDCIERSMPRIVVAEPIADMDTIAPPAWEYFANLPYNFSVDWFSESPVFTVNTSRGCPYGCTFCSVGSVWGRKYRAFSAQRVVSDIEHLIKTCGIKGVYFREDNFTFDKKRTHEICEILLRKGIKLKWACETRADTLERDMLRLMYDAGCRGLYIGVESGSQRILDLLNKGIRLEQVRNAFNLCRETGIKTYASFVLGIPTETEAERTETILFADRIKPDSRMFNVFVGLPKSPLYQYIIDNNLYEYIDDRGIVYQKGHDYLINEYSGGAASAKVPAIGQDGFITKIHSGPKVSVIMCVYNGEKYLRSALESILSQTFREFEFIIVNDGSSDNTSLILNGYADPRIKLINNPVNSGLTKSLNIAVMASKGEFIAQMDADDISTPDRIEKQLKAFETGQSIGMVGTNMRFIDENGNPVSTTAFPSNQDEVAALLMKHYCCGQVMYRRDAMVKVGHFDERYTCAQDYDIALRIAEHFSVTNINDITYEYRIHPDSISSYKRKQQTEFADFARRSAVERRAGNKPLQLAVKEITVEQPRNKNRDKLLADYKLAFAASLLLIGKKDDSRHIARAVMDKHPFMLRGYLYYILSLLPHEAVIYLRSVKSKIHNARKT